MDNLPPELWDRIFSFLDLRSLCSARAVSRNWWKHANNDRLWKPLVMQRGISERFLPITYDVCDTDLENCKWAAMCFEYYRKVLTNWAKKRCKITEAPHLTDTTVIQLPYMVRVFKPPKHHVDILELRGGDFVHFDKIPLPGDQNDEYDLTMTTSNVFVVYAWNYPIIYKFRNGSFHLEKALFFLGNMEFESCSESSDLDKYIELYSTSEQIVVVAASEEIIWMYSLSSRHGVEAIYAWNYERSEQILTLKPANSSPFSTLGTSSNYIFWFFDRQFSVYSLDSTLLYYQKVEEIIRVEWDRYGFGFISLNKGKRKASFVDFSSPKPILLEVENPLAIAMHGIDKLAYCLCKPGNNITIACVCTHTGRLLWQTTISARVDRCPPLIFKTAPKMCVIHGKYIVIHEVKGDSKYIFSKFSMSLYSASNGSLIWSHCFLPNNNAHVIVNQLSDHFIMTSMEDADIEGTVSFDEGIKGCYRRGHALAGAMLHNLEVCPRDPPPQYGGYYNCLEDSANLLAFLHGMRIPFELRSEASRRLEFVPPNDSNGAVEVNNGDISSRRMYTETMLEALDTFSELVIQHGIRLDESFMECVASVERASFPFFRLKRSESRCAANNDESVNERTFGSIITSLTHHVPALPHRVPNEDESDGDSTIADSLSDVDIEIDDEFVEMEQEDSDSMDAEEDPASTKPGCVRIYNFLLDEEERVNFLSLNETT